MSLLLTIATFLILRARFLNRFFLRLHCVICVVFLTGVFLQKLSLSKTLDLECPARSNRGDLQFLILHYGGKSRCIILPLTKFLLDTDDFYSIALRINCGNNVIVYSEEMIYEFVNIFVISLDIRVSLYFQCSTILSLSEQVSQFFEKPWKIWRSVDFYCVLRCSCEFLGDDAAKK